MESSKEPPSCPLSPSPSPPLPLPTHPVPALGTTPAFELQDVSLRYPSFFRKGKPALDGVSLSVPQGAICGLLGRNAAGKTSLITLLAAYRRPTQGKVLVFGQDPYENPAIAPDVAFIYTNNNKDDLSNSLRTKDHLELAALLRPRWDAVFADRLLERFAIPRKKTLGKLSMGQRAALYCTIGLASRAPLTIFDEAYLGMDAIYRRMFVDELLTDYLSHPRTILFSTHYIGEMERLFTEALIIDKGRVLVHDDCDNLRRAGSSLQDLFVDLTLKEGESA
ncbi:MAG: ABC transporter ATP-binding protein [Coriobacteriaceae bacterium]|nr:ABC transporter ATP-binding protein [Coriobacteriaceae bacterium]